MANPDQTPTEAQALDVLGVGSPTPGMIAAGLRVLQDSGYSEYEMDAADRDLVKRIYAAMCEASSVV